MIERLVPTDEKLKHELGDVVARNFSGLWFTAGVYDAVEKLSQTFAAGGLWREGWFACKQTMRFESKGGQPDAVSRLSALEAELRPSNLAEQVRAIVLSDRSTGLDLDEMEADDDFAGAAQRLETKARELGEVVGVDETLFAQLIPDMMRGGTRAWAFGRGLAAASPQARVTWTRMVEGLGQVPAEQQDVRVLRGFLSEVWGRDRELAESLLDAAIDEPILLRFIPPLQTAVEIDERGIARLQRALEAQAPVQMYRYLAFGGVADHLSSGTFKALLLLIADQRDGFEVALEILYMRFHSDRSNHREHEPELLEAGRELLRRGIFPSDQARAHRLAEVVKACLTASDAGQVAADVAGRLRQAVANYETYSFNNEELLRDGLKTRRQL